MRYRISLKLIGIVVSYRCLSLLLACSSSCLPEGVFFRTLWSPTHEKCLSISVIWCFFPLRPRGRGVNCDRPPSSIFPSPPLPPLNSGYCTRLNCPPLWQTISTAKIPFRSCVLTYIPNASPFSRPTSFLAPVAYLATLSFRPAPWKPTIDPSYSTSRIP